MFLYITCPYLTLTQFKKSVINFWKTLKILNSVYLTKKHLFYKPPTLLQLFQVGWIDHSIKNNGIK